MTNVLYRIFNVQKGEEFQAFLFTLLAYIWAISVFAAYKYADALFLHYLGPEFLPHVYTAIAILLVLLSLLIVVALRYYNPDKILMVVLGVFSAFYFFCFAISTGASLSHSLLFWFSLKAIGYSLYIVINTCFWMFVDQYYHIQDAKRLFTLFGTAVFLGDVTTGALMNFEVLSLSMLFLFIAIPCLFAIGLSYYISRKCSVVVDDSSIDSDPHTENQTLLTLLKAIFTSPFTLLLLGFNFFMQLSEVLNEYNNYTAFTLHFGSEEIADVTSGVKAPLTVFLGKLVWLTGVFKIIVGLFVYSRLAKRYGINNLVVFSPFVLILTYAGWVSHEWLIFPLVCYFVNEGTVYVIDDNNFSLLLTGVPTKVKYKVRIIIESFFEPIAMIVSAALLYAFGHQAKFVSLILSIGWFSVALGLRRSYLRALIINLWDNTLHIGRTAKQWYGKMKDKQKQKVLHRLLAILRYGDQRAEEFAIDGVLAFDHRPSLPKLLSMLDDCSPKTKFYFVDAVEETSLADDDRVSTALKTWLETEEDPKLAHKIRFFLASYGKLDPSQVMNDLHSEDPEKFAPAIIALRNDPSTKGLAAERLKQLLDSNHDEEICLGLSILGCDDSTEGVDRLVPFLDHPSPEVFRTASRALSLVIDKRSASYSEQLIDCLARSNDYRFRLNCLDALAKIVEPSQAAEVISATSHFRARERRKIEEMIVGLGKSTVNELLSIVTDQEVHHRSRMLAARILGELDLAALHSELNRVIENELERAWFYLNHYYNLEDSRQGIDLKTLSQTLKSGYEAALDFIIDLLGVAGSLEDTDLISKSLKSSSSKIRAAAIEALEKSSTAHHFRAVLPLANDSTIKEKLEYHNQEPLELYSLLEALVNSPSQADQIVAATLLYQLDLPGWRESIKKLQESNDQLLRHFAAELLER